MALLSPKNFMIPFTNKVHLATIAFVVILFAAFRAMGGAFSVQSIDSSRDSNLGDRRSGFSSGIDSRDRGGLSRDARDNELDSANSDYDELDGAVRNRTSESTNQSNPSKNDLDEIIRKLNAR